MTIPSRPLLTDRPDLSVYWDNHLRDAFEEAAANIYPPMVEASLAHVWMLDDEGILPRERSARLEKGLLELWERITDGRQEYVFDGSVEDPYYFMEQQLAAACGISTSELDVQLARSRNDLDAGAFRMVLRRQILDQADLVFQAAADAAELARRHADALIIGFTHRRPAQPTTIGHVLGGLAEALLSQGRELLDIYAEMNVSPLGSAAFTGSDVPINPQTVAGLLGFDSTFTSSYEAVAGAEHFMRLAAAQARICATGARFSRVLLEWMTFGWVATPNAYTQGSSIMPQKKNPVVLEHMVSMAGAAAADMSATYANINSGWYEDSNNATTDVQKHLWRASDRVIRFVRMLDGLLGEFTVLRLPDKAEIVRSGATTTSVAEALAVAGVPWRGAHDVVGRLFKSADPTAWSREQVTGALAAGNISADLADLVLAAGTDPGRILDRPQAGSPGIKAVTATADLAAEAARTLAVRTAELRAGIDAARAGLLERARALAAAA
ncbi:argininosuccinate lyase [Arthrobacter gandavensis]|uniref:lyase family protein n=1 Tax=Arthrobacter gandavensis TaxID=169960 RepID=UPI00188DF556|nr:lyase family protein [Arthrobacter gandavensis]MBF4993205.1 argininosuccinate lyase [Arthrobacter gandavensis]